MPTPKVEVFGMRVNQLQITDGYNEMDQSISVTGFGYPNQVVYVAVEDRKFGFYQLTAVNRNLWVGFRSVKNRDERDLHRLIEAARDIEDHLFPISAYNLVLDGKFKDFLIAVLSKDDVDYAAAIKSLGDYSLGVNSEGKIENYGRPDPNIEPVVLYNILQTPTVDWSHAADNPLGAFKTRKINFRYTGVNSVIQASDGTRQPEITLDEDYQDYEHARLAVLQTRDRLRKEAMLLKCRVPLDINLKPNIAVKTLGLDFNDWVIKSAVHGVDWGQGHVTTLTAYANQNFDDTEGEIQYDYGLVTEATGRNVPVAGVLMKARFWIMADIHVDEITWKWERVDPVSGAVVALVSAGSGGTANYIVRDNDINYFLRTTVEYNIGGEDYQTIRETPAVQPNQDGRLRIVQAAGQNIPEIDPEIRIGDTLIATLMDRDTIKLDSINWLWETSADQALWEILQHDQGVVTSTLFTDPINPAVISGRFLRATVRYIDGLEREEILEQTIGLIHSTRLVTPQGRITGNLTAGNELIARLDEQDSYAYSSVRWFRAPSNNVNADPATWTPVAGGYTDSIVADFRYTTTPDDVGSFIICQIRLFVTGAYYGTPTLVTTGRITAPL